MSELKFIDDFHWPGDLKGLKGKYWKAVKFVTAVWMGDDAGWVVFMQISASIPMAISQIK